MKLTFFGAAGEVGRSCILLETDSAKILLDAGVKLGEKEEYPLLPDSELRDIDAILVTHAHLDHIGYLPHIFSAGYKGLVYATKPTFELTNVLLGDYMRISGPKNVSKEGLNMVNTHFKLVEYHKEFKIKDMGFRMFNAGHILGSAMIEAVGRNRRLLYTGDLNLKASMLLDPAYTEHLNADTLITESTYGGRNDVFPSEKTYVAKMIDSVKETIARGGKIIIPSFAVGRGQEVLFLLDNYIRSGVLPKVPIYVDGMINKALRIHRHNVIDCREELQKRILMSEDDPFKSPNFHAVTTKGIRAKVIKEDQASIIVTTSGMLTGGPVIQYIQHLARDPKNKLILVGYQAEGTLGRDMMNGAREVRVGDRKVEVKLGVESFHISAHADQPQLMRMISRVQNLKNIFIVHGEHNKSKEFQEELIKKRYKAYMPMLKQEFNI